uniref:Pyr_redox_2 domain-containing protein n=1 Tax=Macrostomum lignano TaxID=282301 RepID=A0A1I8FF23_9PLAT
VSVRASDQMVLVEGTPPADGKFVVQRPLAGYQPEFASEHFVIVGGGPAAAAAADSLRQEGYRGKLTVLSADSVPPFDRTKLSKAMAAEPALLRTAEHYAQHDIELMLESRVESVDPAQRTVEFQSKNGRDMYTPDDRPSSIASKTIPGRDASARSFLPAQPEDSKRIHAAGQGADAVLIGSSFIALESAAYLVANGAKSVTVLARDPVPFKALFGEEAGKAARRLHESKGVKFGGSVRSEAEVGRHPACSALCGGHRLHAQHRLPAAGGLLAGGKPGSPLVVGPDLRSPSDSNVFLAPATSSATGTGRRRRRRAAWPPGRLLGKPVRQPLATSFFWTLMFGTGFRYTALAAGGDGRPSSPWKRAVVAEPKEEFKFMTYLVGEADQAF